MPLTFSGFFLGTGPFIDPTEGNNNAENAAALVNQTYGGVQNALVNNIVTITSQNIGGNAAALEQDNNVANDEVVVNDGSGPVTYVFDAAVQYAITITYIDGSSVNVTGIVFQTTTGQLFLAPGITPGGPYNAALTAAPIRSVTINSVVATNFLGLAVDRAALTFPTCFAEGTLIATPRGPRAVEQLRTGDLVLTADRGAQPLCWVGGQEFSARMVDADPGLAPVRIAAGALGPGVPARDLLVSRQHRIVVCSAIARRMAGPGGALVAAHRLVGLPGIAPEPPRAVAYRHLMFEAHEVVLAEGAPAESFLPGRMALAALPAAARAEVLAVPALLRGRRAGALVPARPVLTGARARRLVERHARNRQYLVESGDDMLKVAQFAQEKSSMVSSIRTISGTVAAQPQPLRKHSPDFAA